MEFRRRRYPPYTVKTVSFFAIWLIAAYNFAASIYYHGKAQRPENRTGLEPFIGAGAHRVLPDAARAEDARENASLDGDDE